MVNPAPSLSVLASPSVVCEGEALALSVSGAASYSWSNGSNQSLQIVYPALNSSYTITGVSVYGCNAQFVYAPLVNECAGINESKSSTMFVYPNPSQGHITITAETGSITIKDLSGRWIGVYELNTINQNQVHLNGLDKGIYLLYHNKGKVIKLVVN